MAKRFKFKLSRVMPSFQLCRSKKASNLPENPVPVSHLLSPVNPKAFDISFPNLPAPPPSTPADDYSFIKRHLSPKIASVGCGCRARSCTEKFSPEASFDSSDYSWKKEATLLHIVAKAQDSNKIQRRNYEAVFSDESNGDIAPASVSKKYSSVKNKENKKEKVKAIVGVSSHDSGCFSSEEAENEETETLISTSMSSSYDSSIEFDHPIESITAQGSLKETKKNKHKTKTTKKTRLRSFGSKKYRASQSSENETPASGSILRRMMPGSEAEGKVKESVAVVKKSDDPYEDFKRSMLEMILEKQIFEAKDLEQLLQCFLSLNSRQYHEMIVEAFTEIWEALFCDYPMNVI